MDYNSWASDLKGRGYSTTGLGKTEANFADYGHALSDELKNRISQNAQTQEAKELQAFVASLFGGKSNLQTSELLKKCRAAGLQVTSSYQKTTYILDEKNRKSPGKGTKQVKTGSVNVIEITDPKTGAKMVIADSNGNAAIEIEEVFLNEILSGVTSDIKASNVAGLDSVSNLEQQKAAKEAQLAEAKAQNAEVAKQIEELETLAEKDIEEAEKEIAKIQQEIEDENEAVAAKWLAIYQANPDKYSEDYINSQIGYEINSYLITANSSIAAQESRLNNNKYLTQIDDLVKQYSTLETQTTNLNQELQNLSVNGAPTQPQTNPANGNNPQSQANPLNSDAYAVMQNGNTAALPQTQAYNTMLDNLKKDYAYSKAGAIQSKVEMGNDALSTMTTAQYQAEVIEDNHEAEEARKERLEEK